MICLEHSDYHEDHSLFVIIYDIWHTHSSDNYFDIEDLLRSSIIIKDQHMRFCFKIITLRMCDYKLSF